MMEVQGLPSFVALAFRFKKQNHETDEAPPVRTTNQGEGVQCVSTEMVGEPVPRSDPSHERFVQEHSWFLCISKTLLLSSKKQTGDQMHLSVRDALAYYSCLG